MRSQEGNREATNKENAQHRGNRTRARNDVCSGEPANAEAPRNPTVPLSQARAASGTQNTMKTHTCYGACYKRGKPKMGVISRGLCGV